MSVDKLVHMYALVALSRETCALDHVFVSALLVLMYKRCGPKCMCVVYLFRGTPYHVGEEPCI